MFDMVDNYDTECPNMIRKIVKVCLLLGKIVQIFIQFDEFFGKISVRIGDFFSSGTCWDNWYFGVGGPW